jgi:hypothetical protein
MIPLRKCMVALAEKFGLLHQGQPAPWAMDIVVETLHQATRPVLRPDKKTHRVIAVKRKRVARWSHPLRFSQAYPASVEPGWRNAATGKTEEEIFIITVQIPPKQPKETFAAFERRFNQVCRRTRDEYVQSLKAKEWETRPPYVDFTWIDRFAQWQSGRSAAEIAPSIKLPAFSRRIRETGHYIGISPRLSKHNPKRRSGH